MPPRRGRTPRAASRQPKAHLLSVVQVPLVLIILCILAYRLFGSSNGSGGRGPGSRVPWSRALVATEDPTTAARRELCALHARVEALNPAAADQHPTLFELLGLDGGAYPFHPPHLSSYPGQPAYRNASRAVRTAYVGTLHRGGVGLGGKEDDDGGQGGGGTFLDLLTDTAMALRRNTERAIYLDEFVLRWARRALG